MYKIGEKTWSNGNEVTITSEPFILHGGEFQNAVKESGKPCIVPTPEYKAAQIRANQDAWKDRQAEFRKLSS